jgi:hypothetical protein
MKFLRLCASAVLALALVGCAEPGFFSVGGWIPGAEGGKANFGGYVDACNFPTTYGHLTYHDKGYPLRLEGHVTGGAQCVNDGGEPSAACVQCQAVAIDKLGWSSFPVADLGYAEITYRSQDKRNNPGTGTAFVCVADFGEGANADDPDFLYINVETGPYGGYENWGEVKGNINQEDCPYID